MVRHRDRQGRNSRLPWVTAACVVILGLALSLYADANGDLSGNAGSLAVSAAGWSVEIGHHHSAPGHRGAGHCPSGPSCGSAGALSEAAAVRIAKPKPMLFPADVLTHQRNIRPPLHPPNPAVQG